MMRLITVMFLIGLLAACTTPSISPPSGSVKAQQSYRAKMSDWRASGNLAFQSKRGSGSATFSWQEHGNQYDVRLAGPLGMGTYRIERNAKNVVFTDAGGRQFFAPRTEVIADMLGWHLPTANLKYWLLALPATNMPAKAVYDNQGFLVSLQQNQWQIHYADYMNVNGLYLPGKILIQSPALKLKIHVRDWKRS